MPVNRYNAIRQFYTDAERELEHKKRYGSWE